MQFSWPIFVEGFALGRIFMSLLVTPFRQVAAAAKEAFESVFPEAKRAGVLERCAGESVSGAPCGRTSLLGFERCHILDTR